jgi:hypothetical protein
VLFRPWRSESHVLTAHLIENEQRGEMTFWDKASGVVALKSRLEAEQGRTLTLRPLEDALHAMGLSVNTATLGLHLFATERLRTIGEAVADLSGLDVKTIQPRLNALKRYAQVRTSITEDELYAQVFEPVFQRFAEQYPHTGTFSVAATCEACEVALARHLGEPVDGLRDAVRRGAGRSAQANVSGPAIGIADAGTLFTDLSSAGDETAEVAGAEPCELLIRAKGFADAAGLVGVVHPAPQCAAGLRLGGPPADYAAQPEQERAWWLLAGLLGELDAGTPPPASLDLGFLHWLIDFENPSATAFWELLACTRRSGLLREMRAASRSVSASEGE